MKFKYLLLALFTVVIWGVSLPVTTILLDNGFTANNITFFRFFIATVIMHLFLGDRRKQKIEPKDRINFMIMGLCGTTLFFYFENTALRFTSVSNTALITALIPLFTLVTAVVIYRKKILWQNYIGIPLGLMGTALLFYKDIVNSSVHLKGDLFVFGSVLMWVAYSFVYRKVSNKYKPMFIVYKTFIYGCLFTIPMLVFEYREFSSITINLQVVSALFYLSILCSLLGYYFWILAINNIGIKATVNLILLLPVVSVSAGVLFLSEPLNANLFLAMIAIMASSYLTSISKRESYF
ncbi:MAG: DMT family transporter [Candidatus Cloacimonadota bacterium]|nr:DMT family transporter [Candidatus Cloacimonadota bacterium]